MLLSQTRKLFPYIVVFFLVLSLGKTRAFGQDQDSLDLLKFTTEVHNSLAQLHPGQLNNSARQPAAVHISPNLLQRFKSIALSPRQSVAPGIEQIKNHRAA